MMTLKTTLQVGQSLCCPHCGVDQGEVVEDFTVPGRVGEASACSDTCSDCHAMFRVLQAVDGSFEVSVSDADIAA
jgi:uncharacterized protein (DUF983 family)